MEVRFNGKRALVTGGGRGIGRAIVEKLLQCGARVVIIDKIAKNLKDLKEKLPGVETILLDLAEWDMTREVVSGLGHFDFLINNAGVAESTTILDNSLEMVTKSFDINFKSILNISQIVAKGMIETKRGGAIVSLASVAGHRAISDMSIYCCTKAAVIQLTRCLALELGKHGIRVNSVSPGPIMTEMRRSDLRDPKRFAEVTKKTPIGRFGETEEVANVVVFLLSDYAGFVHGGDYPVDGGHLARN